MNTKENAFFVTEILNVVTENLFAAVKLFGTALYNVIPQFSDEDESSSILEKTKEFVKKFTEVASDSIETIVETTKYSSQVSWDVVSCILESELVQEFVGCASNKVEAITSISKVILAQIVTGGEDLYSCNSGASCFAKMVGSIYETTMLVDKLLLEVMTAKLGMIGCARKTVRESIPKIGDIYEEVAACVKKKKNLRLTV